jgi:hypothetical protein
MRDQYETPSDCESGLPPRFFFIIFVALVFQSQCGCRGCCQNLVPTKDEARQGEGIIAASGSNKFAVVSFGGRGRASQADIFLKDTAEVSVRRWTY